MKQLFTLLILSILLTTGAFSQENRITRDEGVNNDTTVVFTDSFLTNINRWDLRESKTLTSKITEGVLELKGKTAYSPTLFAQRIKLSPNKNFEFKARVAQRSGARNMGFGICWGAKVDNQDWYTFLVSTNGKYTILRKQRQDYSEIKKWTESDFVVGMDKTNELKIVKQGSRIEYYINDNKVFVSKFEKMTGDKMGILFHGTMKLQVDEISIREF